MNLSKAFGIYRIRNTVTGAVYIGSTQANFKRRWEQHTADLEAGRHPNSHLRRAWRKHGADAFAFEVVEVVADRACVLEREQYYLDERRNNYPRRLNYNHAWVAGSTYGIKYTARGRRNISKSRRTPEEVERQRRENEKRWKKPGEREKLSQRNREQWQDPEYRARREDHNRRIAAQGGRAAALKQARTVPGFVAPDGTVYRDVTNLQAFAREHGVNYHTLYGLVSATKRRKTACGGWRRLEEYAQLPLF